MANLEFRGDLAIAFQLAHEASQRRRQGQTAYRGLNRHVFVHYANYKFLLISLLFRIPF